MGEERCPNCRTVRHESEMPCSVCGWMPLRPTEMLILGQQNVRCPFCSLQRPAGLATCPHCGSRGLLEPLSRHVAYFHTSSLLLLAGLVAICLVIYRTVPVLGIVVFVLVGLATVRTLALVVERKRHRYPGSAHDLIRIFGSSVLGIIVAGIVFGASIATSGIVIGPLFAIPVIGTPVGPTVLAILTCTAGAIWAVDHRRTGYIIFALGMTMASLPSFSVLFVRAWSGIPEITVMFVMVLVAIVITAIGLSCYRNGARRAKSFLVGAASGYCLLAMITLLPGNRMFAGDNMFFAFASLLLWPSLLTVMTLQQIWSWDDAFPTVRGKRPHYAAVSTRTHAMVIIEDVEGIEYPADAGERAG